MEIGRIAELLRPFAELTQAQFFATSIYIDLLAKWNAKVSLTAIRDPGEVVTRHFGESYFAARTLMDEDWAGSVVDFGSGAGFPGIPMALIRSRVAVTLIESNGKKAAFLGEVVGQLGLKNVQVFRGRGETFNQKADLVVMRAVENFEQALGVAAGLVRVPGRMGLLIGEGQVLRAKASQPQFTWAERVPIPCSDSRVLFVGKL
jgi:16S rRNA (guanine527-N7)-methyltransferase